MSDKPLEIPYTYTCSNQPACDLKIYPCPYMPDGWMVIEDASGFVVMNFNVSPPAIIDIPKLTMKQIAADCFKGFA